VRGALLKIVSGGQTGADRAALDAALTAGTPCGGWCPRGRRAEDGVIPQRYPLAELVSPHYPDRTLRNVQESDATVILAFGALTGGSAATARCCRDEGKPCLVIDAGGTTIAQAAGLIADFIADRNVEILNVAGPRASGQPEIHDYVYATLGAVLRDTAGARRHSAT
jgi:hypothetical protein